MGASSSAGIDGSAQNLTRLTCRAKNLSLAPDAGTGRCEYSGPPPGLTSPTAEPASLSGLGLHLAGILLLPAVPDTPTRASSGTPRPFPGLEVGTGAYKLKEANDQ